MSTDAPNADDLGISDAVFERALARWQAAEGKGQDLRVIWNDGAQLEAFSKYAEDEQRRAQLPGPPIVDRTETGGRRLGVPSPPGWNDEAHNAQVLKAAGLTAGGVVLLLLLFKRRKP